MRWVVLALALAVLWGCSHDRFAPIGDAAPAFGSTTQLSTVQGFAAGAWRQTPDPAFKSPENGLEKVLGSLYSVLTLTADGKATLEKPTNSHCVAHGSWTVQGDQIAVSFTDVDGLSFDEVKAQYARSEEKKGRLMKLEDRLGRRGSLGSYEQTIEDKRDFVMTSCERFPMLVIASDGKHLQHVGDVTDFERHMGVWIWARVK